MPAGSRPSTPRRSRCCSMPSHVADRRSTPSVLGRRKGGALRPGTVRRNLDPPFGEAAGATVGLEVDDPEVVVPLALAVVGVALDHGATRGDGDGLPPERVVAGFIAG